MSLGIGVIGAGIMGADHAATIARNVAGAELAALFDPDPVRAGEVARASAPRHLLHSAEDLIAHPQVDAIIVASPDHTHPSLVLRCLEVGKPVLCEKPLAPTAAECLQVVEAESGAGRRMVQVGFMRRFDPSYLAMKAALGAASLGQPRFFHSTHRNASAPSWFTSEMVITNSAVHDIDIARWLLDCEITQAKVFAPAPAGALRDPQFLVLRGSEGLVVTVEVFINARYGYDIRGEVACDNGALTLSPPDLVHVRQAGSEAFGFAPDWRPRFADAYRNQLQAWVNAVQSGTACGASAWDGYVATAVAEACLKSLEHGAEVDVPLEERPAVYARPQIGA
jgi:myo-inositol 2-dehydrogenase / D-chiro-inositol 1-dehydrogenase